MRQERKTLLTKRITVLDSKGETHTVEEWSDMTRAQFADNTWSEWVRSGGRLKMGKEHINETDDDAVLEVAMTSERLTVVSPQE